MGNGYELPIRPHEQAYPRWRRVRLAYRFIRDQARIGSAALERTKAARVAETYGLETNLIKRIKARFRNELSFVGDGK